MYKTGRLHNDILSSSKSWGFTPDHVWVPTYIWCIRLDIWQCKNYKSVKVDKLGTHTIYIRLKQRELYRSRRCITEGLSFLTIHASSVSSNLPNQYHRKRTAMMWMCAVPWRGLCCISKTTLCSVESVQLITENYRKVPSNTELYRKWTKKLAYKPYLKISLNLLCIQNKPFAYQVRV